MLFIKTLRCRITVKQKEKVSPTSKNAGPSKPSYLHMQAQPIATGPSAAPSHTATEGKGSGIGEKREISSQGTDPMKVAEKVYQLILEEARDARRRGMS
jgi:hypothetical protein